jgi:hypothetical protein
MKEKKFFPIPTKEQLRNRMNIMILESKDDELYEHYNRAIEGLRYFGHVSELAEDFKKDKELIKLELKRRGLKVPNFIYDLFFKL